MRPWIVSQGIEQPTKFDKQPLVRVVESSAPMKRLRQVFPFLVQTDAPENRVSAAFEGCQVLGDPIRRHLAVRIGGQDHAAALAAFLKPGLGDIHRRTTGVARVRRRRG
jgi:hypothetical protein